MRSLLKFKLLPVYSEAKVFSVEILLWKYFITFIEHCYLHELKTGFGVFLLYLRKF